MTRWLILPLFNHLVPFDGLLCRVIGLLYLKPTGRVVLYVIKPGPRVYSSFPLNIQSREAKRWEPHPIGTPHLEVEVEVEI